MGFNIDERKITITDCPPGTECVVYVGGKEVGRGVADEEGNCTFGLGVVGMTSIVVGQDRTIEVRPPKILLRKCLALP